jgi:DNA-binding LacI/PurR family transcriptional regulator
LTKNNDNVPRYRQVMNVINERIASGEYPIGHKLPPERVLQDTFKLSRMTINRALTEMANQGLIKREVGVGSFVLRNKTPKNVFRSIGIITPSRRSLLEQPFYWEVIEGIDEKARELRFRVILAGKEEMILAQDNVYSYFSEMGFSGVILAGQMAPAFLDRVSKNGLPVVCLNFSGQSHGLDSVVIDCERGGKLVARHLIKLGHRRIGMITGPRDNDNSHKIQQGFLKCLAHNRIPIEPDHIVRGDYMMDGGYQAMLTLLDDPMRPSAVFCASDMMAIGALNAAKVRRVDVPEQMSLVGFDDCRIVAHTHPSLTTVRTSMRRLGAMAVELIQRREKSSRCKAENRVIPVDLIERESSAQILKKK